jgi:hypothetical protein
VGEHVVAEVLQLAADSDALSSFSSQSRASLHEISRVMGLPGKPKGFDGGEGSH